jgi:hypothetical protein|eukprot:31286-Pelagococcus_subviridis.AAC.16
MTSEEAEAEEAARAPCSRVLTTSSGCSASVVTIPAVAPEMASRQNAPFDAVDAAAPPSRAGAISMCARRQRSTTGTGSANRSHGNKQRTFGRAFDRRARTDASRVS